MNLEIGTELIYWECWLNPKQRTAENVRRVTITAKGRKYYTAISPGGTSFKIDCKLVSSGQHPLKFYLSLEDVLQKKWCDHHGFLIGESVKHQSFEVLEKIADLIGYQGERFKS